MLSDRSNVTACTAHPLAWRTRNVSTAKCCPASAMPCRLSHRRSNSRRLVLHNQRPGCNHRLGRGCLHHRRSRHPTSLPGGPSHRGRRWIRTAVRVARLCTSWCVRAGRQTPLSQPPPLSSRPPPPRPPARPPSPRPADAAAFVVMVHAAVAVTATSAVVVTSGAVTASTDTSTIAVPVVVTAGAGAITTASASFTARRRHHDRIRRRRRLRRRFRRCCRHRRHHHPNTRQAGCRRQGR